HRQPHDSDLIGRASVVGKIFQRSDVAELSPADRRDDLGSRLMALVRKELVRPDRSGTTGDEAFRFRHLLVRDAAYASLTKEQRADLHARFADWLERIAGDRLIEYEEVIAYHLEQGQRYRSELGLTDDLTSALRSRATAHLRAAGMRALGRNDQHAAANLLGRAAQLVGDDRERGELLLHVAACKVEMGDLAGAAVEYGNVKAAAARAGDEELGLRAELNRLEITTITDPAGDEDRILALADQLETLAKQVGNKWGRIAAEQARATVSVNRCRWMDVLAAQEMARGLMGPGEDPRLWSHMHYEIWNSLRYGPISAADAIARMTGESSAPGAPAIAPEGFLAPLVAMQGQFEEARRLVGIARSRFLERGMMMRVGDSSLHVGFIELLAGEWEAAQRDIASGIEILSGMGETGVLSSLAAMDADALYRLGRRVEMEAAVQLARESGSSFDIYTQARWRSVAAMASADDGRIGDAEHLIAEAVAMVEPTDFLELRARAFEALAHVEARAGRRDAWKAALERALAEHQRKGNLVGQRGVWDQLAAGPPPPAGSSEATLSKQV